MADEKSKSFSSSLRKRSGMEIKMRQRAVRFVIISMVIFLGIMGTSAKEGKAATNPTPTPMVAETPKPTQTSGGIDYLSLLSMDQSQVNTTVGQTTKLSVNGLANVGSYQINWYSEDCAILIVNQRGEVTAMSMTGEEGVKVYCTVTIMDREYRFETLFFVSAPSLYEKSAVLRTGKTKEIRLTGLLGQSVATYETSDPGVALVS